MGSPWFAVGLFALIVAMCAFPIMAWIGWLLTRFGQLQMHPSLHVNLKKLLALELLSFASLFGIGVGLLGYHRFEASIVTFASATALLAGGVALAALGLNSKIIKSIVASVILVSGIVICEYLMGIVQQAQTEYYAESNEKNDRRVKQAMAEHPKPTITKPPLSSPTASLSPSAKEIASEITKTAAADRGLAADADGALLDIRSLELHLRCPNDDNECRTKSDKTATTMWRTERFPKISGLMNQMKRRGMKSTQFDKWMTPDAVTGVADLNSILTDGLAVVKDFRSRIGVRTPSIFVNRSDHTQIEGGFDVTFQNSHHNTVTTAVTKTEAEGKSMNYAVNGSTFLESDNRDNLQFIGAYGDKLYTPIPVLIYTRITNLQSIAAQVVNVSFNLHAKGVQDVVKTIIIPASAGLYGQTEDHIFKQNRPNKMLLEELRRPIPPHQFADGWIYLDVDKRYDLLPHPLLYTMKIKDSFGNADTVELVAENVDFGARSLTVLSTLGPLPKDWKLLHFIDYDSWAAQAVKP